MAVISPAVAKCLVISKVLIADGMMMEEERAFLAGMMDQLGLTAEERDDVTQLKGIDQAERIVSALTEDERREVVELLVDAAVGRPAVPLRAAHRQAGLEGARDRLSPHIARNLRFASVEHG